MNDILNLLYVVLGIVIIYFIYKFLSPYFVRITHVFYVSGSPGTGKDVLSSNYAIARYKVGVRKWRKERFKHNLSQLRVKKSLRVPYEEPKPVLMSSIPLLLKYHKNKDKQILSYQLDLDVLLLRKRLPRYSVVYISDINRFINQYSYKNLNVQNNIAEFISEFRHYTYGGYFIANSQASSQVAKEIRNTFGKVRNNLSFKKFLFLYKIEGRTITLSEDVINVEQGDADKRNDNATNIYGFLNPFVYRYDTYAYYGRVTEMEYTYSTPYVFRNTNYFFILPSKQLEMFTINEYKTYKKDFKLNKRALLFYYLFGSLLMLLLLALTKILWVAFVPLLIVVVLHLDAIT